VDAFKDFAKKRQKKQFFMGIIFIAILLLGWRYPLVGFFIPLCMLLGAGIGLANGRKWCDWYCPRGSFSDFWIKLISPKKDIPLLFKDMRFRVAVLAFLTLVMAVNLILRWPNATKIGNFFVVMLTVTTLLGVVFAVLYHQRSWCSFCPIGTLINLTGRKNRPLTIDSPLCIECGLCRKVCPLQIKPYLFKDKAVEVVKDRDCLGCGSCVLACPKQALKF
jgi:polyferredoxin